ncbi:hypothetical protein B0H17DRAFT_890124, partial [Mycena rosella]
SKMCRLCNDGVESMHHLFVMCSHFHEWRRDAVEEVETRTERKSLFNDDPSVWPLKITQFYVGQIPSTQDLITSVMLPDGIKRRGLSSHIALEWHTSAIRLAGRIFGSVQRTMA